MYSTIDGNRTAINAWLRSEVSSDQRGPTVDGNEIRWSEDGWVEVQSATSFNTMSEGGRFATVPNGLYNVINHTTGERHENIRVGEPLANESVHGTATQFPRSISSVGGASEFDRLSYVHPLDGIAPTHPIIQTVLALASHPDREYQHLLLQSKQTLDGGFTYQNAQFTDGVRASLISLPGMSAVMIRSEPDGTSTFYRVTDVGLELLTPGSEVSANFLNDGKLTVNSDGSGLEINGLSAYMSFRSASYTVDSRSGQIEGASYYSGPSFGFPVSNDASVVPVAANLWHGADLVNRWSPAGSTAHGASAYDYYASTPEGAAILAREEAFYDLFGMDEKSLFVARTRYLRDEGGIELFEAFMPKRTALLDDPVKLAEYDAHFDRFLAQVSNSSTSRSGGIPGRSLDESLQIVVAADAAEAFGHSAELVSMVISDLDRGWSVANDIPGAGGRYHHWQPLFESMKGHITLDLGSALSSFADPHDSYDVVAHEMVHSLDGYGNDGLDGLPAFSSAEDRQTFLAARAELTADYHSGSPSLPFTRQMDYAFTNNKEFLARFSELFLTNRASAETVRAVSPELYDVFSRFYGIDYQ